MCGTAATRSSGPSRRPAAIRHRCPPRSNSEAGTVVSAGPGTPRNVVEPAPRTAGPARGWRRGVKRRGEDAGCAGVAAGVTGGVSPARRRVGGRPDGRHPPGHTPMRQRRPAGARGGAGAVLERAGRSGDARPCSRCARPPSPAAGACDDPPLRPRRADRNHPSSGPVPGNAKGPRRNDAGPWKRNRAKLGPPQSSGCPTKGSMATAMKRKVRYRFEKWKTRMALRLSDLGL